MSEKNILALIGPFSPKQKSLQDALLGGIYIDSPWAQRTWSLNRNFTSPSKAKKSTNFSYLDGGILFNGESNSVYPC
jgi:hypothetical protein